MEIKIKVLEILKNAKKIAMLTGAGVSAESGIKTFRDPDGFWAKLNPQELASVEGFLANPKLVWSWYQERRRVIAESGPNPGHYAIAKMEEIFDDFTLITQNVDRLHQIAGSKNVLELHGNIIENHCQKCNEPYHKEIDFNTENLPRCEKCSGMVRPSVVWFGEMLPFDTISGAENAARNCDVFFSVGTSAEVYPAANIPVIAKQSGAYLIEVNPDRTALTPYVDYHINQPSGIGLPFLLEKFNEYLKDNE